MSFCCFSRKGNFTVVPVLVGSLSQDKEQMYGKIFARYLADPENFFVISSDFCHWGRYTSTGILFWFIFFEMVEEEKKITSRRLEVLFWYNIKLKTCWELEKLLILCNYFNSKFLQQNCSSRFWNNWDKYTENLNQWEYIIE